VNVLRPYSDLKEGDDTFFQLGIKDLPGREVYVF
jgi:hypothetical protein